MKTFAWLVIAVGVVGAGWFFWQSNQSKEEVVTLAEEQFMEAEEIPAIEKTYTMAEVAVHKDAASCLTVIRGDVYDLTAFVERHPGGSENIMKLCGIDGTAAFEQKHGSQEKPENALTGFRIGTLAR